jgi:hypothetical protein
MRRDDPFLAGDQRDFSEPTQADDFVINLTRKQAQGQADHARAVGQHAFNGEMGLACIGRAKDGGHLAATANTDHVV